MTIWDVVMVWLGWYIVAPALLFVGIFGCVLLYLLPSILRRVWCKHDGGIREDMSCTAWCQKCGARLGFIGTWREKQAAAKRSKEEACR